ncbi:MAG: hypothetical protein HQ513_00045 [Rhodospirillales bacterium]|nr:hypothetical protein [Rhodospirillales bacterium]
MRDFLKIAKYVAAINNHLRAKGISVSFENSYGHFIETRKSIRNDPQFSAFDEQDFQGNQAIWLHGTVNEKTVLLQAIKLIELEDSLAHHFRENVADYSLSDINLAASSFYEAPVMHEMSGRVCYHGEFWVDADFRGSELIVLFSRLILVLSQLIWDVDYVFGIVPHALTYRGVSIRYGYTHTLQHGFVWRFDDGRTLYESLVWASRDDISYLIRHSIEEVLNGYNPVTGAKKLTSSLSLNQ